MVFSVLLSIDYLMYIFMFQGERKGQNKYYPPDFDWRKHSSLNAYQGVHALRERARKLDRGILIIRYENNFEILKRFLFFNRFEMPYNIWCNTCGNHIGMGVRYNAEKTKIGNYFTTPIFQFRMKCHLCDGHFEIKTDPKVSLSMKMIIMKKLNRLGIM